MSQPDPLVTPRHPRDFFRGVWTGAGEVIPNPMFRWFARRERVHMTSQPVWLSDTVWIVKDRFQLASGRTIERQMFCQLVAPDRVHVTADDIPRGADILLSDRSFCFTPYDALVTQHGLTFRLRCYDENTIDDRGFIHDSVRMYFCGIRVATMRIGPISRNGCAV